MERIGVTITNWGKHQRSDVKKPTWFALDNGLLDNPDLADFGPLHFHVIIYIFSQASKRNSGTIDIVFLHAKKYGIEPDFLTETLKKLESVGVLTVHGKNPHAHVQEIPSTDRQTETTDKTDKQTRTHVSDAAKFENRIKFNFQEIFDGHPKHEKKAKSFSLMAEHIHTQEDFDNLKKAVANYKRRCELAGTEYSFILSLASFMDEWREWIDWQPTLINTKPQKQNNNAIDDILGKAQVLWNESSGYTEVPRERLIEIFGDEQTMKIYFAAGGRKLSSMKQYEQRQAIGAALAAKGAA